MRHEADISPRVRVPKVSVVIPAFNYAQYLGQCLESILEQSRFSDFEVIAIDDASTDDTDEVIRSFHDKRLHYLRHGENLGHIRTINDGLDAACGRYLVHVGADDYWHPEFLATVIPILDRYPEVGLVHSNCATVDDQGNIGAPSANVPVPDGFKGNELSFLLLENYFPPHGTVFRREGLERIGGHYREDIPYAEDWRLWLAMGKRFESYFIDRVLVYYRTHGQNLHTGLARAKVAETSEIRILDEFFNDFHLPEHIQRLESKVYARRYERYGDVYFAFGMMTDCRRCLREVVRYHPRLLVDSIIWRRYIASLLPPRVYRRIKTAYYKLARGSSAKMSPA